MNNKYIIIGSTALKHLGLSQSFPKDIDIASSEIVEGFDCIILPYDILEIIPEVDGYATLDALYTIKCSHLGWDIKWQKHKDDALYMKAIGAKKLPELYEKLVTHWKQVNGNKDFLSLYKKKSDFFNDYVNYVYDHDYLHSLVAYPNEPVYTLCLKDGESIAIDKTKFDMLSLKQQLSMFREEVTVISIERWLVNPKCIGRYSLQQAYSMALHKTVTQLTKNWASEFLIDNLDYFVIPQLDYFTHAFNTIKEGKTIMSKRIENKEKIINEVVASFNELNGYDNKDECDYYKFVELGSFGEFERIKQEYEGGREYYYLIFKWKEVCYKFEWAYYSHIGYNFKGAALYKVTPVVRVVTAYE